MPISGTGTKQDPRGPKYQSTFQSFSWGMYDYGNEPWCLVGIQDVDGVTDTTLTANPDVLGLPSDLDAALTTAQRNRVANALESANIPGTWLTTSNTWRDAVTFTGAVCQFAQRYQGGACGGVWFTGGITLASTFGSLPANVRTCIADAATSFGFDTSAVTGSTTLRQLLLSAGQQYQAATLPLVMAGVSLYTV